MAKFCSNCGKELDDNVAFCPVCGTRMIQGQVQDGKGFAITGLVFSIIGVFPLYGFISGLLGLIFGIVAKKRANKLNYKNWVIKMSIADIVIGIVTMALWVLVFLVFTLYTAWKYGWNSLV